MQNRVTLAGLGAVAVALWIVGLVVGQALPSKLPSHATDQQVLDWVSSNTNDIIIGAWLFMVGCIVFVAFALLLRTRLPEGPLTTAFYTGAVMAAVGGLFTQGDFVTGINKGEVTPAAAAAAHHLGDLGFSVAELSLVLVFGALALLAFKARVLPKWWGAILGLFAVVAVIGPIGWTMVIFGAPLFTLVTPWLVGRGARRTAAAPATVTA
jgi:hypothetical protein